MKTVHFGLNLDKYDGQAWLDKVEEFRKVVEEEGEAKASWGCMGRTRHQMNAMMLKDELPQFEFEIDYDSYKCIARKK